MTMRRGSASRALKLPPGAHQAPVVGPACVVDQLRSNVLVGHRSLPIPFLLRILHISIALGPRLVIL